MNRWGVMFGLLFLIAARAAATEGRRSDSIDLNGQWEFALGDGTEDVISANAQGGLTWQPVTLPGRFMEWNQDAARQIKYVWVRREFTVTDDQAKRLAVLRWNRIVHGATAYINGQLAARHEPTGPFLGTLPQGMLHAGKNTIVLRVAGAAGAHRAKSGHFLFPVGQIWGPTRPDMPSISQDVWIEFANKCHMKWILAMPDLDRSRVRFRVTPWGPASLRNLRLQATVRPWPKGDVVGTGSADAELKATTDLLEGDHFFVDVPLTEARPWTPDTPDLYQAEIALWHGSELCDRATIRFGMREIEVVDGDYLLNGRTLRILGSNLVHEWDWADVIRGKETTYLCTEAREMNIRAFRTHTQPPPPKWSDICDECGTMILAEFPVLYNYRDPRFTPEEWEIFHRNAMLDAAGWMQRLWNHPSVIMWVLSNESRMDNQWESGPFRDFVVRLDPTRPTMRTGTTGTKTNYDVHTCGNTNHWTHEGQLQLAIEGWFQHAGDRTVTNSEYMNIFDRPRCQWTGTEDEEADRLAYAQLGMEHTEAMRRARLDGMLPYMYAGWTRTRRGGQVWKGGFAQPVSACWHSALSPVLASLDLFDANYLTGQTVTTDVCLINDSWNDADIHVDLMLTRECPEFLPEAACFDEPVARRQFDFHLPADSLRREPVTWQLPDEPGSYWLTARTTGIAGRAVLSQRFVRAVSPPRVPRALRDRTIVLLGGDDACRAYFKDRGIATVTAADAWDPNRHVVLIWDPGRLSDEQREKTRDLLRFAAAGGHIVVLGVARWEWRELCDLRVDRTSGSRVFPYPDVWEARFEGLEPACLKRWNGLPGTVALASITGPAVASGTRLLWVREPRHTVVAEVVTADGKGRLLFSALDLRHRAVRDSPHYDPAAEWMLLNLLIPRR